MLNLLEKLMVLNCQIMFSLAIAEAILMQTFTVLAPSLQRVVPKYLKPVTSANIWPLMIMSAPMLLVLLVMILLFFCANFHCICTEALTQKRQGEHLSDQHEEKR